MNALFLTVFHPCCCAVAYTFFVKGNEQVFMLTSLMGENLLTAEFDLATGGHKDFHGKCTHKELGA